MDKTALQGRVDYSRNSGTWGRRVSIGYNPMIPADILLPFIPAMRFYDVVLADKFAMVFMVEIALCPILA